ncbi:MAG TPA: ATP-binding protein [Acidimicrobiales bacterium]|nr:ATP-binding protein [Acidimicrobiales bacterium]
MKRAAAADQPLRVAVASVAARLAEGGGEGTGKGRSTLVPAGAFADLAASFGLEPLDLDLLVVAAAPDLDLRLADLLGSRVTIGRSLTLLGIDPWDASARARLAPTAPLVHHALVQIGETGLPFPQRTIQVPDRVVGHLLGEGTPDPSLVALFTLLIPAPVTGAPDLARAIESATWAAWVRERPGTAGWSLAAAALGELGLPAIGVDLARLPDGAGLADVLVIALREAALRGGALVIGPVDARRDRAALSRLGSLPCPVVLVGPDAWDPRWSSVVPFTIDAPAVSADVRLALWSSTLGALSAAPDDGVAAFRLAPEQIVVAAAAAATQAAGHGRDVSTADVLAGVRAQNAGRLDQLAQRIEPVATFDSLVVREHQLDELRSIVHRVRNADVVRDEWGMGGSGGGRGRGVTCLFAGPSGVGKTLSAEVLAHELGVDLYTIDLSQVVDKYIGETEKNLERIFTEAEGVNGVLFFDEADALFGKRSDVQSAHDRHANVEVAYLLQRMERFDGVAVLATNLRGNLDEAFTRRIDVIVQFAEPDVDERLRLWQLHLPPTLPVADDLDLALLAKALDVTGGVIRNITLAAAYVAAAESRPVEMSDLVSATRREYRKVGRLVPAGTLDGESEEDEQS